MNQVSNSPDSGTGLPLEEAIHSAEPDALRKAATDPGLNEDLAVALLQRTDLPADAIESLSKNSAIIKSRKAKLAIVSHPHTPRYVSVGLIRQLFTFDLLQVALTPTVPADVKIAADEALIHRMETISSGERLAMARRGSGRIAARLLADSDARVMNTALDNPRLTEVLVVRALNDAHASAVFVNAVCGHAKWSVRQDVKIALLRNPRTPLHKAIELVKAFPPAAVRDILRNSRLSAPVKAHLLEHLT